MIKISTIIFVLFFVQQAYCQEHLFDSTKVYVGRIKIENNCPMPNDKRYLEFVFTFLENKPILKIIDYSILSNEKKRVESTEETKFNKIENNQYIFVPNNSKYLVFIKIKERKSILIIQRVEKTRILKKRRQKVKLFLE